MTFELEIDAERWRRGLRAVVDSTPGIVPVIKGNGYGLGRDLLAAEAKDLGLEMIAVGTYAEVPDALAAFGGDVMVLTPWRPFFTDVIHDERVIHTVGRVDDIAALAAGPDATARVLVEGETSMARHGLDRHELAAAVAALGELRVEGFAIHLPMAGVNLREAENWAAALEASQVETTAFYVSHLTPAELTILRERRPQLDIRPRIGTALWLGDLGALSVRATVLDTHLVARGERVGYRQRPMPRDGALLVISGGTSNGIALEAPKASAGVVQRGKSLAKGGLEAAGFSLSPFTIDGKQRWFAEPPHMQASMVFLPASARVPQVGDRVDVAGRVTTPTVDASNHVRAGDLRQQPLDLTADQQVLAREAVHGTGQPRRGPHDVVVQPRRSFGEVDVRTEVTRDLHQGDLDASGPPRQVGRGRGCQGVLQRSHRLAQLRPVATELVQHGRVRPGRVLLHGPSCVGGSPFAGDGVVS